MNILSQFYNNESEREAVKAFMIEVLEKRAVEKVFKKEDITGIYDARKVIDDSFDKLEELYKHKEKPVVESSR